MEGSVHARSCRAGLAGGLLFSRRAPETLQQGALIVELLYFCPLELEHGATGSSLLAFSQSVRRASSQRFAAAGTAVCIDVR